MIARYKVILDCDNSFGLLGRDIDDGLALLYLLGRVDIDLLGITLCFGNAALPALASATQRLLVRVKRAGLPLKIGASQAGKPMQRSEAAEFLVACAAKYPGQVIVVATGPLSNLAAAAALDADFFNNLAALHIMGGITQLLRPGRLHCNELNLSADPAAAHKVLTAQEVSIKLFTAEVCLQAFFGWPDLQRLSGLQRFIQINIVRWLSCFSARYLSRHFYLWDVLPAVAVTHPQLFEMDAIDVDIDTSTLEQGRLTFKVSQDGGNKLQVARLLPDRELFLDVVCQAWREAATRQQWLPSLTRTRATAGNG